MSTLHGIQPPVVERVVPQSGVRRVERDQSSENPARRQHHSSQDSRQQANDTPQDIVEVRQRDSTAEALATAPPARLLSEAVVTSSQRHVDITG
ncbi:MAG: hypothetical protein RMJ43_02010 [Chloroherpetonaceae bacterium]|nr:hypothetical protein [Chthonomonadaceae bacterium]MDW8206582.1 hypothetical protein [Chloroherpetonaceae bacterium]